MLGGKYTVFGLNRFCALLVSLRMADLSSCRQDSRASRSAMFSMPVELYYMEGKVNSTLQSLYGWLVDDLNKLANEGISTNQGVPRTESLSFISVTWDR